MFVYLLTTKGLLANSNSAVPVAELCAFRPQGLVARASFLQDAHYSWSPKDHLLEGSGDLVSRL